MERTSINNVNWGRPFPMDQGQVTSGATRHLRISGQTSLIDDPEAEMGLSVSHPGDMREQVGAALAHIDQILEGAGIGRGDIVSVRFFTTDIDALLENYDVYAGWIGPSGVRPPQSMLGVARLALPDLVVEIEAEAAQ